MKKTVCVLLTLLSAALFCACGGRETAVVSNANASMMIPDSNIVEGGTFSAKAKEDSSAVDGVKVEPIAYQEDGKYWFLYLLATNESGEVLHLSADVIFYDSDGKQISKDYSNAIAVDNGITTALDFMCNEQFASSIAYYVSEEKSADKLLSDASALIVSKKTELLASEMED